MVLPLRDEQHPLRSFPGVMYGLIALNVLMFLVEMAQGPNLEHFLRQYAVVPAEYTSHQDFAPTIPFPFWWTTLSAMFLHGGWLHLFGNMIYLRIFGDNIEDTMGHVRFLLFYLLCGVGATLAHVFLNPTSTMPSLGASGAIAGVLGAYVILFPRNRVQVLAMYSLMELPAILVIGFWFVLQLFSGIAALGPAASSETAGGIAYSAHVGGFLCGILLAPLLKQREVHRRPPWPLVR